MSMLIAFCGLDCSKCPAFHAEDRLSIDERRKVAEQWSAEFGTDFTAEQINCAGCTSSDGPLVPYCAVCEVRQCGLSKSLATCAPCADFGCDKLAAMWANTPEARATLEALRAS